MPDLGHVPPGWTPPAGRDDFSRRVERVVDETERQQLLSAIRQRHAVRQYTNQPIPEDIRAQLRYAVTTANNASGLAIQVFFDEPDGFSGLMAHYGRFRGVVNYLAMVGTTGTAWDQACGYWGQHIVLLAQTLGLNSCWVGQTYSKSKNQAVVTTDERLRVVVALGYGTVPGKPHKPKPLDKLGEVAGGGPWPSWFRDGVEAASLAPSGLNRQGYTFILDGDQISTRTNPGSYAAIDLGIAKYHFELGAGPTGWHWA